MLLLTVLRTHASLRVEAPPAPWEAHSDEVALLTLLDGLVAAALGSGSTRTDLVLGVANVVVEADQDTDGELTTPPPGEYVAVTLTGPGSWSSDWTWLPSLAGPHPPAPVSADLLTRAMAVWAYGRDLGDGSSVSIFLRRAPDSPARH
ncbi:MAG: hypothetical protein AB7Q69_09190 [Gemmatimonadales bacterium]